MNTQDKNRFPRPYRSNQVTHTDSNGCPTQTRFYKENDFTEETFRWLQTWSNDGNEMSFRIQFKD